MQNAAPEYVAFSYVAWVFHINESNDRIQLCVEFQEAKKSSISHTLLSYKDHA